MKKIIFAIAIILMSASVNAQQRYLDGLYSLKHSGEEQEILLVKNAKKGKATKNTKQGLDTNPKKFIISTTIKSLAFIKMSASFVKMSMTKP